jgi:hypothetical protein
MVPILERGSRSRMPMMPPINGTSGSSHFSLSCVRPGPPIFSTSNSRQQTLDASPSCRAINSSSLYKSRNGCPTWFAVRQNARISPSVRIRSRWPSASFSMFVARETSIRAQSSSTAHLKNVFRWGPSLLRAMGARLWSSRIIAFTSLRVW